MGTIDANGRYRPRKDWASVSIPSLVNIDEHGDDDEPDNKYPDQIIPETPPPVTAPSTKKSPRRSSLVLSLFSGKSEKGQKRRSSIAVPFFRRSEGSKVNKRKLSHLLLFLLYRL